MHSLIYLAVLSWSRMPSRLLIGGLCLAVTSFGDGHGRLRVERKNMGRKKLYSPCSSADEIRVNLLKLAITAQGAASEVAVSFH